MGGPSSSWWSSGTASHVRLLTSGKIRRVDHDAWRYADFVADFKNRRMGIDQRIPRR